MVKQLKFINDFYYCRPRKGALSSNTCLFHYAVFRYRRINETFSKKIVTIFRNIQNNNDALHGTTTCLL